MKIGLENLTFGYRSEEVLFRISELLVSSGEAVGIVGPSGAGKTTLLRLLAGICLPISGRIVLDGTEMNSLNDAARRRFRNERIGLVFQDFRLLEYLSIRDNMLLPLRDLLVNHCRDHGVTLLMVTHDPQLLDPFDRVIDFSDYQERKREE